MRDSSAMFLPHSLEPLELNGSVLSLSPSSPASSASADPLQHRSNRVQAQFHGVVWPGHINVMGDLGLNFEGDDGSVQLSLPFASPARFPFRRFPRANSVGRFIPLFSP